METQLALQILGALAQETRLSAFRLLVGAGDAGLTAGGIAEVLQVPAPTLSFHLKELSRAGLVASDREGRSVRYRIDADAMRAFLGFLSEDCCQGRPELCLPVEGAECSVPRRR